MSLFCSFSPFVRGKLFFRKVKIYLRNVRQGHREESGSGQYRVVFAVAADQVSNRQCDRRYVLCSTQEDQGDQEMPSHFLRGRVATAARSSAIVAISCILCQNKRRTGITAYATIENGKP